MVYVVVCAAALAASALTLFSGFGLGTLLLPAFLLFFPADEAVALTGIVHLLNNVFKLALLGRHADRSVVLRFGIPAMLASLVGAWLLVEASALPPLASYMINGIPVTMTPVKTLMGGLIIFFAFVEGRAGRNGAGGDRNEVDGERNGAGDDRKPAGAGHLALGGLISGFFGGLSGHQGAFRSVFLLRAGLSREVFLGTGVALACLVDLTRLGVYARHFTLAGLQANAGILAAAGVAALAGAVIGASLVKKASMAAIRKIVMALLILVGVLLLLGVL
jgi:uncharacterized membrane protein YfcA